MKRVSQLSLLLVAMTLASCNEKVTPKLEEGNSTTPGGSTSGSSGGGGPTIVPEEYYFRVVNTSPQNLGYKLHKTGPGNFNKKCEVKSNFALDSAYFISSPATYDVTCYLEAEELALTLGGISLQVESSPNTCDSIGYTPFSYFNRIPGDSTGSYTEINCMNTDTNSSHAAVAALSAGVDVTTSTTSIGCGQYALQPVAPMVNADRVKFDKPETDQKLCRFKYEDKGKENCDIGKITINELQVTFDSAKATKAAEEAAAPLITNYTDTVDSGDGTDDGLETISAAEQNAINIVYNAAYAAHPPSYKKVPRTVDCGGKVNNCIDGPIKKHPELTSTSGEIFTMSTYDQVLTKKYDYSSLESDRRGHSYWYANYRRNLANANIDYGTVPNNSVYKDAFNPLYTPYAYTYDANVMERYSKNISATGTYLLTNHIIEASVENFTYSAQKMAADPFMGFSHNNKFGRTSPFYEFSCYDNAWEVRSRIRIVVRDWDRLVPNNATMELLSDIFNLDAARQDNSYVEAPDNMPFNDSADWDNKIPMVRLTAPDIIHNPAAGLYNPAIFPEYFKETP